MKTSEPPVVVEQTFDHSIDVLWNAVTDHQQMVQWFFDVIPGFKAEVGFETQFNIQNDGRDFLHLWKVIEVVPLKKITTHWSFEGYAGESLVTFELFSENYCTRLVVTNTVLADFDDSVPEFKRESCQTGWEYFIRKSLPEYLKTI